MSNPTQTSSKKRGKRKAQDDLKDVLKTLADEFDEFVQKPDFVQMMSPTLDDDKEMKSMFASVAPRSMQWAEESGLVVLSSSSSTKLLKVMGGMSPGIIVSDHDGKLRIALDQGQLRFAKSFFQRHVFERLPVDLSQFRYLEKRVGQSVFHREPQGGFYILLPQSFPPGLTQTTWRNTLAVNACISINRDLGIAEHLQAASRLLQCPMTSEGQINTYESSLVHQSASQNGGNEFFHQESVNGHLVNPRKKPRLLSSTDVSNVPTLSQQRGPTIPVPSNDHQFHDTNGHTNTSSRSVSAVPNHKIDHTLMPPPPQISRQPIGNSQTLHVHIQNGRSLSDSSQGRFPERYSETGMGIHSSSRGRSTATGSSVQLVRQNSEPNSFGQGGFHSTSVHAPETVVPSSIYSQGFNNPLQVTTEADGAPMPVGRYRQTVHDSVPNVMASGSFSQAAAQTTFSATGVEGPTANDTHGTVGSYQDLAFHTPVTDAAVLTPAQPLASASSSQSGSGSSGTPIFWGDYARYSQGSATPAPLQESLVQNAEIQDLGDLLAETYQQTQEAETYGGEITDFHFGANWSPNFGTMLAPSLFSTDVDQSTSGSHY